MFYKSKNFRSFCFHKENLWLFNYGLTKMIWKDKRLWIAEKASLDLQLPWFVCSFNFQETDMHCFFGNSKGLMGKGDDDELRSSYPKVFLEKVILKICSKFTGEHPCRSVISIKLLFEITLRHECSPVNLLHIYRKPFPKYTSGRLLLWIVFVV